MRKFNPLFFSIFIAITFCSCDKILQSYFILTSVTSQPVNNTLSIPKDEENFKVDENTYTVLLFEDGKSYIYKGIEVEKQIIESSSSVQTSSIILRDASKKFGEKLSVVIKPSSKSSYKNVVNMLDLMSIYSIQKYTLKDISSKEEKMIDKSR